MFTESMSIWGEKPKKKGITVEKQGEFEFIKKTPDECMKEISADARKQLVLILDEIVANGQYTERDIKNIVAQACWIERI